TLSSLASVMRALTLIASFSSDDTSSSFHLYDSAMRPLFLPDDDLGDEALELRRASLAFTLLYLASKSFVYLSLGLCSDE
ncbi:hypothetical protein Tco_0852909, partial [Tanacetum coccineum]